MKRAALRVIACAGAVPLAAYLLDGVHVANYEVAVVVGALLAVIYLILRPLARLLLGAFNFFTLGVLYVALDAWLVMLAAYLSGGLLVVDGFGWALGTALIVNILGYLTGKLMHT